MDAGVYTSAVGMLTGFNVENNIADNLANLQTPGFKERTPVIDDFSRLLLNSQTETAWTPLESGRVIGEYGEAPQIARYGLNLAQGNARHTGSPLDLSIVGDAFFRVRNGNQILFTRNGSFHRSATGTLVTNEGYTVLGANGQALKIPSGTLTVTRTGALSVDGARPLGVLGLARVATGQGLSDLGGGYFQGPGTPVAASYGGVGVLQGYLEGSNVDMANEMSSMVSAQRAYQANSRMLQIQDDSMSLVVNDLGRVGS